MTFATTDCVIVACPLAPSSYSTMTAWTTPHIDYDQGLPVLTTLPDTPSQFSFAPPIQHNRKEQHTLFGWVIGGWGCCWFFSLISTVEGWRLIIFFLKQRPPYVLPMIIGKKCKPGLQLAFAQTWSSLSQAFFPTPPLQSWAGTEHFQLILSF